MITHRHHLPRRFAPVVAGAAVLAACASTSAEPSATGAPGVPTSTEAMEADAMEMTTVVPAEEPIDGTAQSAEQRCVDAMFIMDQRIEAENFEFPEEPPELSEEELEQTLTPAFDVDDSVAAPDERPDLTPMPDFDPNTAPILELDLLVETCFETGIVTDADLDGEEPEGSEEDADEGDLDDEAEFAAWCRELAELPIEEVREFAEEEGADVVREEFEACRLTNPLES